MMWTGLPEQPERSAWHWLLPRNTKQALPVWWDHVSASWQDGHRNMKPDQAHTIFDYVGPITWAIVHEPQINRTTIV